MTSTPTPGPVVRTTGGPVLGRPWQHGSAFLAIPYAEPPFGALRFAAPVPRASWDGVRDCLEYGPTPQRRPMAEVTAIPEPSLPGDDVLSLNVFTPDPAASGLPVLVYVHGGGFVAGSPASPWYDGAAFTRDGVVVVTIAYRLGFEGFGHLPDAPANRGVLDQVLALTWVRDNVAAFGGDPTRVTIAGQSAGGGAVMHLLVAPGARGLFSGVIAISGSPGDVPVEAARAATEELAGRLGVRPERAGFAGVAELDLVAALGIGAGVSGPPDADTLLAGAARLAGGLRLTPTVDGDVLPWTIADGLARGEGADVPVLLGATRDEVSGITARARTLFDGADAAALLERTGLDARTAAAYARSMPDRHPADVLGDQHVARIAGVDPPQPLADAVHGAYVAFVRDHDPGWPRWSSPDGGPVMTWDVESRLGDSAGYASARILLGSTRDRT